MFLENFCNYLNLRKNDNRYLIVVLILSFLITIVSIKYNREVGVVRPDTMMFLRNSLFYAGIPADNLHIAGYMYLSPVICFFTSLIFRLGIVSRTAIFIVCGVFSIIGNVGIYILLRQRFNEYLSLTGVMLYSSFYAVASNWANGMADVPAVAISVWVILFLIIAVDKNPKFYLIAFPLFVVAIFTKYSTLFLLPLILLYYLTNHDVISFVDDLLSDRNQFKSRIKRFLSSSEFKYLAISSVIAIILLILFVKCILNFGSSLFFVSQANESLGGFQNQTQYKFYNLDTLFYAKYFLTNLFSSNSIFSFLSYLIFSIMGVAILFKLVSIFTNFNDFKSCVMGKKQHFKTRYFKVLLIVSAVICFGIMIWGYKLNNHLLISTPFLAILVILCSFFNAFDIDRSHYSLNALIIAWFSIYFIFFSLMAIKPGGRYILTSFVPFVFIFIYAVDYIFKTIQGGFENPIYKFKENKPKHFEIGKNKISTVLKILTIISIVVLLAHTLTVEYEGFEFNDYDVENVSQFLIEHDPNYQKTDIGTFKSYLTFYASWYLKKDIEPISKSEKLTYDVPNSDYKYIISQKTNLNNYKEIYHSGKVYLYENIG